MADSTQAKSRGRPRTRPLNAQRLQIDWVSTEHKALLLNLGKGEMSRGVRLLCDRELERAEPVRTAIERTTITTGETISTETKTYPVIKGVDLMALSQRTQELARVYAEKVEALESGEYLDFVSAKQADLSRTLAHNKYLESLKADGVDVSDRSATTGLALTVARWWGHGKD